MSNKHLVWGPNDSWKVLIAVSQEHAQYYATGQHSTVPSYLVFIYSPYQRLQ